MIARILLAVDDSPPSLRAAVLAVELATATGARLRVVHVLGPMELDDVQAPGVTSLQQRRDSAAEGTLAWISRIASGGGVELELRRLEGSVAEQVLSEADGWQPDLLVMGRESRHRAGEPYVGAQTRHVLEFAEQPVIVVPGQRRSGPTAAATQ